MSAPAALARSKAEQPGGARYRILAPTRYPWTFNGPRRSRNSVARRSFTPFNKISRRLEGVTVFNPLPPSRFDLVHAFNRIPLGRTPFVIGFESHLPRAFGYEGTAWFAALSAALASDRCRAIVAISEHAADIFRRQHAASPRAREILPKLTVRHPNVEVGLAAERSDRGHGPLRLCFVGNHFARKGGCVAVRLAELALRARLPVEVTVVSALQVGGAIWTDPKDGGVLDPYLRLLDLPNVRWVRSLPNRDVVALLRASDLTLLPTLGDTFGFSALESMAQGTPVLATAQGALPEVIEHAENGFLLPLPVTAIREWEHLALRDRGTRLFERAFVAEVERLAREAYGIVAGLVDAPERCAAMRRKARRRAREKFGAEEASLFWDRLYAEAIEGG